MVLVSIIVANPPGRVYFQDFSCISAISSRFMTIVTFPFCGRKLVETGSSLLVERCLLLTGSLFGQKMVTVISISCWTGGLRWERRSGHSGRKWTWGGLLWKSLCMQSLIKTQNKTTLALEDLLWACKAPAFVQHSRGWRHEISHVELVQLVQGFQKVTHNY